MFFKKMTPFFKSLSLLSGLVLTASMSGQTLGNEAATYKLPVKEVSETTSLQGKYIEVDGVKLHYLEQGEGAPILFIHGNPSSSYLWRNVIPHVSSQGRAIAVDLVGMGRSGKPDINYTYADHYNYLEKFVKKMGLSDITLVVHDWGAALGFDLAKRNPALVNRIAFMEGILPPLFPQPSYEALGPEMGGMFQALRDPVKGKEMVVKNNMFIEQILPNFVNRPLGNDAMTEYRKPFVSEDDRDVILAWPNELPIAGEPKENVELLNGLKDFMGSFNKPSLLLYAEPGVLVPPDLVPYYQNLMPTLETRYVGQGFHFIQEDNPDAIGRAISDWLRRT
jgi:haloalkane dehalogenase